MVQAHPPSPCRSICAFERKTSGEDDLCKGCFRTKGEIRYWRRMNRDEKLKVLERIKNENTKSRMA
tara:strand:+ start:284 stop:481 length:198 start_codon:yes stop_codon:yes gene_type:complete